MRETQAQEGRGGLGSIAKDCRRGETSHNGAQPEAQFPGEEEKFKVEAP